MTLLGWIQTTKVIVRNQFMPFRLTFPCKH